MTPEQFEHLVAEEFPKAIPEKFQERMKNIALLIEDEPSSEVRTQEKLEPGETLLGLYQGISFDRRGELYGVGPTMPDTITLYRLPILEEAGDDVEHVRKVIRDTIWHEVAHYFGFDEGMVRKRERKGTNTSN